jgi:ATP-dependent Clp protease adapter protein ClpS
MGRLTIPLGAAPGIIERPEISDSDTTGGNGWIVTVYDNDHNTVDEVEWILQIATGCSPEEASMETWEIHHLGKSVVHHAGEAECRRIAKVIAKIGIRVEVNQE